jgi:hypothetical protein
VKRPIRSCVKCGTLLKPQEISVALPFRCPSCQTKLQVPNDYGYRLFLGSLLVGVAGSLSLGIRGLELVLAVLLSWLPINYLAYKFVKYVVPPTIEIAVPRLPLRQTLRALKGPIELDLRNKRLPRDRDEPTDKGSSGG